MASEQAQPADASCLADAVSRAVNERYAGTRAALYGIDREAFRTMLGAVLEHYAGCESVSVQLELLRVLHVEELVLARACAAGNVAAWEDFMRFYPSRLYETAYQIARDKVAGRELADGLYAELWGLRVRGSNRISKLDSYMGRGSLGGWLRAVLAQRYIDRVRSCAKDVSLEERVDRFDGGFSHTMYFFDGRHGYRFTMASPDSERFEAVAV